MLSALGPGSIIFTIILARIFIGEVMSIGKYIAVLFMIIGSVTALFNSPTVEKKPTITVSF